MQMSLFPISPSGSRPWIKAASAFTVSWLSIHYWCHLQFLVQFSVLKSIRHRTFLDRQWTLIAFNWQGVIHRKPWTPQFDTLWKENASVVNLYFNRQMSDIRYHSCICQKLECYLFIKLLAWISWVMSRKSNGFKKLLKYRIHE